jgi:hypothetical protein
MKKQLLLYFVFLSLFNASVFSQVSSGDSTALVTFFNSTGGSGWTTKTNWNSANAVGTWFGVSVSNGRVVGLNLSGNNLIGAIPSDLGNLTNLTQLQLFNNQLSGSIPAQIGNLVNLTSLGLENNLLSGALPTSISNMTILNSLTLSGNNLTDSIPVVFADLTSLQQLDIRNNRFNVMPNLSTIGTLNTLRAEGNKFTFEDLEPNIGIATFTYSPQDSVESYASVNAAEGSVLPMTVSVGGTNNVYQWKKNGSVISGANSATYQIDSVKIGDAGTYTCDITNTVATAVTIKRRTITVSVTGSAPSAPSNLTATAVSTSQINLSWTASSGILLRYRITRSTSPGSGFVQIDSTSNNAIVSYSNTDLPNSKTIYYYRVFAVGNFSVSGASNTASDTTFNASPVRTRAIQDTSVTQGFPKIFYRKLADIFSDPDDTSLTYTLQSNPAEILATRSTDTLYLQGVPSFSGTTTVIVSAGDGSSSVADTFNVTTLADNQTPQIGTLQLPTSSPAGTAINVSCTVTDNGALAAVRVFYRRGSSSLDSLAMTGTGTYSAQIPDTAVTLAGISVFVKAIDNGGNVAFSDTSGVPVSFTQIQSNITGSEYPTGIPSDRWRLVSVPVNLNDKSLLTLFSNISRSQWIAYSGAGTEITSILPGQGFWFFQKSGNDGLTAAAAAGVTNDPTGVQVVLAPQTWTLIGTPYTTPISISLDPLQFSTLWTYGGAGTEAGGWTNNISTMKPFGGYAIYNKNATATTITIAPTGISVGKSSSKIVKDLNLTVSARANKNGLTYADRSNGLAVLENENASAYNEPEPPNVGSHISAYFSDRDKKLSFVYTNAEEGVVKDLLIETTMDDVTIDLDIVVENIRSDWGIRIFDYSRNEFVGENGSIRDYHKYAGTTRFKVMAGTALYLDAAAKVFDELPKSFALLQNYPNPFNPTTRIRYDLSLQGKVTLKIYNILGQEIQTLLHQKDQEAGKYDIEWNGRDRNGRTIASGMYLYRIQVEAINGKKYTQVKKMLFVK